MKKNVENGFICERMEEINATEGFGLQVRGLLDINYLIGFTGHSLSYFKMWHGCN